MNWIEKILSRKNTTSEKSENIDIMEDLFIDNTQPAVQEKVHTEVIKKANNGGVYDKFPFPKKTTLTN